MAIETPTQPKLKQHHGGHDGQKPAWTASLRLACGGCTVLGLILLTFAYLGVRSLSAGLPAARVAAERFLDLCAVGKGEEAFALTSRKWRETAGPSGFQAFLAAFRETAGDSRQHSLLGNSWFGGLAGMPIALRYQVQNAEKAVQILVLVVQEPEGMRVQACHFSTPSTRRPLLR